MFFRLQPPKTRLFVSMLVTSNKDSLLTELKVTFQTDGIITFITAEQEDTEGFEEEEDEEEMSQSEEERMAARKVGKITLLICVS